MFLTSFAGDCSLKIIAIFLWNILRSCVKKVLVSLIYLFVFSFPINTELLVFFVWCYKSLLMNTTWISQIVYLTTTIQFSRYVFCQSLDMRDVFSSLTNINGRFFRENCKWLLAVRCFLKKFHRRCLTGF